MIPALKLLIVISALISTGCLKKSEPNYFPSYQEAKEFCDEAVGSKNLSNLIDYADFEGVPEPQLKHVKAGLTNFESAISNKTLESVLELSPDEHNQFLKDEFAKQTPGMQELTGSWPEPTWNVIPNKFLVYIFASRQPGAESVFKITFGLSHQHQGWRIVCSY